MSPADVQDRRYVREDLAALIDTNMVAGGSGILTAVYDHKANIGEDSPVCLVLSGGSIRDQKYMGSSVVASKFRLLVIFLVVEISDEPTWTPAEVEDKLDTCEKQFTDVIADNRGPETNWNYVRQNPDEFSQILPTKIGGKPYIAEVIQIIARKSK